MSTAGYLQDAKNQQKRLAETITSKGITATATEKYKDLVDKVAQIENLKGEERTLENFTNVLSEPKSVVQLKYPNNTPKTLNAKLGSKNLLPLADSGIYYNGSITGGKPFIAYSSYGISDFNNIDVSINRGVYAVIKLTEGETYTLTINNLVNNCATQQIKLAVGFRSSENAIFGTGEADNAVASNNYNPSSFTFTVPSGYPYCLVGFYNYPTVSGDTVSFDAMQLELGTTATDYTPYVPDLTAVKVSRCGKNLFDINGFINLTGNSTYYGINDNGELYIKQSDYRDDTVIPVFITLEAGTYTLSSTTAITSSFKLINLTDNKVIAFNNNITFSIEKATSLGIKCYQSADTVIGKLQLELGSTATSYEPYQGQNYTTTTTGEVTGITNLYPTTTLLTNNAGVVFEQVTGGTYKEILPSTDKNGITKVYQPSVDSSIDNNISSDNIKQGVSILGVTGDYICNYTYDETTKELVLLL